MDGQRGGLDAASPSGAPEWSGFGGIGNFEHGGRVRITNRRAREICFFVTIQVSDPWGGKICAIFENIGLLIFAKHVHILVS